MDIEDFTGTTPEFLPEIFFAGALEGWDVLENLVDGLRKRYSVEARGSWDAAAGIVTFSETWTFDDGRSDTLDWKVAKLKDRRYSGVETRIDDKVAMMRGSASRAGIAFAIPHVTYRKL